MSTQRMPIAAVVVLCLQVFLLASCGSGGHTRAVIPYPDSIAAIGDSWTAALCIDASCAARPADSWATGANPAVNSQYRRILAHNPAIRGRNFNLSVADASAGPRMDDLALQGAGAIAKDSDYIVIALGENDACGGTPLSLFSKEFADGLARLARKLPRAHVFVLSIENVANQWRALEADQEDRTALKNGYTLDCSLGGTATAAKLASVASGIAAYNKKLQAICTASLRCRYDGGAVYGMRFTARDFSKYDLQHLSIAGQHALSAVAWNAGYRFSAP